MDESQQTPQPQQPADKPLIDPRLLSKEQLIEELLSYQQHYQVLESEKMQLEAMVAHLADNRPHRRR